MKRPWWLWLASASFLAYFVFLNLAFHNPRKPNGFSFSLVDGGVGVTSVANHSPASRAGLRPGDRIVAFNGNSIRNTQDVNTANAILPIDGASEWLIDRDGSRLTLTLEPLGRAWVNPPLLILLMFLGFALSLALGLLVAWRGPGDATSLIGAWLLASFGTVSLPLFPRSMAAEWLALPLPLGLLLWPAAISALATHVLLFWFCARIAKPHWSPARLIVAMVPGLAILAYLIVYAVECVYVPALAFHIPLPAWMFYVGPLTYPAYFFVSAALLISGVRTATDPNERRRAQTLLVGVACGGLGVLALAFAIALQQTGQMSALITGPALLVVVCFCVFPFAFAYAAARQRLFDLRVIVRLGLQYALARGFVLALVPLVAALLVVDMLVHGDQPLRAILADRGWTYGPIVLLAILAYSQRTKWMTMLDRRFFRERYAAHQILKEVVEDIRSSNDLDTAAAKVVSRIDSALHPTLVAVMKKPRAGTAFTTPSGRVEPLDATNAIARVVRALARPVSFGTSGLRDLPAGDRAWLQRSDVELVVPIVSDESKDEALLVLGPKRSEEPYAPDDIDLLGAIAASLSMVMGRAPRSESAETRTAVPDGRRLGGRYRLESVLGEGGMGIVYAAVDETLGRPVAVKLMRDEQLKGAGGLERFQREARAAASLAHAHIVTVHDFGVDNGEPYLVMERLSGRSLRSELHREKKIALPRALPILDGIAAAIEAAHGRGIVHRDLKPENVFLTHVGSGESAKVLDFGIAKMTGHDGANAVTNTSTGVLIGTLPYMSPEQIGGGSASPSWDVWSFSVIAYEMLSGVHPFKEGAGGSGLPIMRAPKIRAFAPDLPEKLDSCFESALSLNPADRPRTARAVIDTF